MKNFVCTECGCTDLEEVQSDCFVTTRVVDFYPDTNELEYGAADVQCEATDCTRYQCVNCGNVIATGFNELLEFFGIQSEYQK